jgi:Domain of unknown function (DUF4365)
VATEAAGSERPRRTKEHINASKSHNYIEKFFIDKGHTVDRPGADYGYDVLVNTYDAEGYAESGEIRVQLKASDEFEYVEKGTFISYKISIKHYNLWMGEVMPVFLILYDATQNRACWVYIQEYFSDPTKKPKAKAESLRIRVPVANEFTDSTVDYARDRKAAIFALLEGKVTHHG